MKYLMLMFLLFSALTSGMAQNKKELQLTANVSESQCAGTLHTVAIEAHGGKAPYSFSWSDSRTGKFRNDLRGGTYICTVSDSEGKMVKKTFTLSKLPQELTANIRQEKTGDSALVFVDAQGGKAPYIFTWFGRGIKPEQSPNQSKKLSVGEYQVVIMDATGCSTSVNVTVVK